jgi:hypothetical protein
MQMTQKVRYVPGRVDDQILTLTRYRQRIRELIARGDHERLPEEAAYWMQKVCDSGCEVTLNRETSERILQDLQHSIHLQLEELRSLYADSSFFV